VTFLGYCSDLRPFLDAVDIFTLTSRYESFGYVTCEAMAMGKPVVATNVTGSNELVLPGVTGYLVDVADPQSLALALGDLAADWRLRRRMGEAGRARAREHYDLRRMIRDVERVYRELFWSGQEVYSDRTTVSARPLGPRTVVTQSVETTQY
jgi:glycosyltransferase involved in cell wall biosynthesis